MATLLSICQDIARGTQTAIPSTIVGNTGTHEAMLFQCMESARKALYRVHPWVDLQLEHTFSTVNAQAGYDLPADFGRIVDGTVWDRERYWQMRGQLTPKQWQVYKSSILGGSVTIARRYRMKVASAGAARQFFIDPTPDATGEDLVYEYVSRYLVKSTGGTAQLAWAADTDEPILYEELFELEAKWRFLQALGVEYRIAADEAENAIETLWGQENPGQAINLQPANGGPNVMGYANIPEAGYGT